MTAESNYAIAISTLGDWLKKSRASFSTNEKQNLKPIAPCTCDISRTLSKLHVTARNSDWFVIVFAPVVIDRRNYFGIGFSTVN